MSEPSRLNDLTIVVKWFCGYCNDGRESIVRPSAVYVVGGCQGMHEAGEYCYCSGPESRVSVTCPTCNRSSDFLLED